MGGGGGGQKFRQQEVNCCNIVTDGVATSGGYSRFQVTVVIEVFIVWLDLSGDLRWDFLGIQNNLKIHGSAHISWRRSSVNKVQPNLFCGCFKI